jgi:hypothetical protein
MIAPARIEGNDGRDGFGVEKLVDPVRIEATIVDGGPDADGQGVGRTGLEEAVETRRPHGEVRDMVLTPAKKSTTLSTEKVNQAQH